MGWRWPLRFAHGAGADPVEQLASLGTKTVSLLWCTAAIAGLAVLSEVFRYVLLVRSRSAALGKTTLVISDALVGTAGVFLLLFGIACGVLVVLWALRAREVASERAKMRSPRPTWQVVAGVLVPGANVLIPGSALAELEHATLVIDGARDRDRRPSPSWLVLGWWVTWVVTVLLGLASFLWSFRDTVQAMADGVVLHAWNDLAVLVLTVLTIQVVRSLTTLLTPVETTDLYVKRVLEVRGAPAPPRAARPRDASR